MFAVGTSWYWRHDTDNWAQEKRTEHNTIFWFHLHPVGGAYALCVASKTRMHKQSPQRTGWGKPMLRWSICILLMEWIIKVSKPRGNTWWLHHKEANKSYYQTVPSHYDLKIYRMVQIMGSTNEHLVEFFLWLFVTIYTFGLKVTKCHKWLKSHKMAQTSLKSQNVPNGTKKEKSPTISHCKSTTNLKMSQKCNNSYKLVTKSHIVPNLSRVPRSQSQICNWSKEPPCRNRKKKPNSFSSDHRKMFYT